MQFYRPKIKCVEPRKGSPDVRQCIELHASQKGNVDSRLRNDVSAGQGLLRHSEPRAPLAKLGSVCGQNYLEVQDQQRNQANKSHHK